MGHHLTALILPGPCDAAAAAAWDVPLAPLPGGLTLAHTTIHHLSHWQDRRGATGRLDVPADFPGVFPDHGVVLDLAAALAGAPGPTFALVQTDYHGGVGDQWACVFDGGRRRPGVRTVNEALRALGVRAADGLDEFDTVGLRRYRNPPESLERYEDDVE